ncbi:hypothetical protein [Pseudoalteromonas luteoviolacea]|uniref:hypothetical protein n=1 Tax=Pseudoalteromonas luteoviolacea TaxID=43657 RepID=UPI001152DDF3|nr:hypothetical protein [Pseudoalteromonas luteoviolacea]TQF70626.1 hypothetical protein FLM44_05895 [Pseudoalteromonas luteoviolacea]
MTTHNSISNFIATVDREKLASLVDAINEQDSSGSVLRGALSLDDADQTMRDMNTLLSSATGVALAKFLESGDTKYLEALENLNHQAKASTEHFIQLYESVLRQG